MAYPKKRGSVQANVRKKSEKARVKHRSRLKRLKQKGSGLSVPGRAGNKGV